MEEEEEIKKEFNDEEGETILDHREYIISHENKNYNLRLEIKEKTITIIISLNDIIEYNYRTQMSLAAIDDKLGLNQAKYNDLELILKLFDKIYEKKKIFININNVNGNDDSCTLIIKLVNADEENTYEIKIFKNYMKTNDKFNLLFNQIKELKDIKDNSKKNIEQMNNQIKELKTQIDQKDKEIKNIKNTINQKDEELKNVISLKDEEIKNIINQKDDEVKNIIIQKDKEIKNSLDKKDRELKYIINQKDIIINEMKQKITNQENRIKDLETKYLNVINEQKNFDVLYNKHENEIKTTKKRISIVENNTNGINDKLKNNNDLKKQIDQLNNKVKENNDKNKNIIDKIINRINQMGNIIKYLFKYMNIYL